MRCEDFGFCPMHRCSFLLLTNYWLNFGLSKVSLSSWTYFSFPLGPTNHQQQSLKYKSTIVSHSYLVTTVLWTKNYLYLAVEHLLSLLHTGQFAQLHKYKNDGDGHSCFWAANLMLLVEIYSSREQEQFVRRFFSYGCALCCSSDLTHSCDH
jgi:hypothetical protein